MKLRADRVIAGGAADEPITIAEAKKHCRIDGNDEDDLIGRLIAVARQYCEDIAWRKFATQTMLGGLDCWPADGIIELPYPPAQSITAITYTLLAGGVATVAPAVYGLDTKRCLIYLQDNQTWPSAPMRTYDPITVTWVAGAAPGAVAPRYLQAILLMVGHYYENREAAQVSAGLTPVTTPLAVETLLLSDRGY